MDEADLMINSLCSAVRNFFGNPKIEKKNLHSFRHLADQVRTYGPLYVPSAVF